MVINVLIIIRIILSLDKLSLYFLWEFCHLYVIRAIIVNSDISAVPQFCDDLDRLCKEIVAEIDSRSSEFTRKHRLEIIRLGKQMRQDLQILNANYHKQHYYRRINHSESHRDSACLVDLLRTQRTLKRVFSD